MSKPTIVITIAVAFAVGVVSALALTPPARAQEPGDLCAYTPHTSPAAVACTSTLCVVCVAGSCRKFSPASCWPTVKP